ncbi:MAG: type II toxin-antitoxin system VapC family toxin [Caulobacter sp.]|nr:type II toxin-antitoxin system VapC family toxin [Caulobacter sp.]
MPPVVVDACFVAALLTREDHSGFARERFQAFDDRDFAAPALICWEVANILWKKTRRGELNAADRDAMLDSFDELMIGMEGATPSQTRRLLILSDSHGLTAYDAAYLELALRREADLATLDADLAEAARAEGLTVHSPFA